MHRKAKSVAAVAAAIGTVVGGAVLAPATAEAAGYINVCGSGYTPYSHRDLIGGGTVYLAGYGKMRCAVTVLNDDSVGGVSMSVWLRQSGSSTWVNDPGVYHQYAGPVYVYSNTGCADYGGRVGTSQTTAYSICW